VQARNTLAGLITGAAVTHRDVQPRWPGRLDARFGLALVGALLGLSQTVSGVYSESTWAPIALGALALALALAVGLPRRQPLAALLPLLCLSGWSWISSGWSDSSDASHIAGDRWLLYAAALAVLWWGIGGSRRAGMALLAGCSAGVLGVAVWMLLRMLEGHGASLFLGTRLNDPLGYVNGEGAYLLAGMWPCLALAERRSSGGKGAVMAGAGLGGVVLLSGVGLLTQSRGWGLALIGSTLLLLAVVPGRRRRGAIVLLCAAAIAAIYVTVSKVWRDLSNVTGMPTAGHIRDAGLAIILGALVAAALWAAAVGLLERLAPPGSQSRARAVRLATGGLAAFGLAAVVATSVNAGAIAHRIRTQYDAFVHLAPGQGSTRLFSGAGNRYDYWRVAWLEFRSAPLIGVGAGNYQPGYYLHRRTTESIQQPHSIELQTLAETGLIGGLMLAVFLVAIAIALRRTARSARTDPLARTLAVAAGGIFAGWLIQTSVDWMHLIPGLTAIALAGAASLLVRSDERPVALVGRARITLIAISAVIAVAGAVAIAPRVLSLHAQAVAETDLAHGRPRAAIADATTALNYDGASVQAFILRAAGFARLHDFPAALANLRLAISTEPRNWAIWALLGDLFTRRGEWARAHAAYEHALSLDPREPALKLAVRSAAERGRVAAARSTG
jgi:hypothetical protein